MNAESIVDVRVLNSVSVSLAVQNIGEDTINLIGTYIRIMIYCMNGTIYQFPGVESTQIIPCNGHVARLRGLMFI